MTGEAAGARRWAHHDLRLVPAALITWLAGMLGLGAAWWCALGCGLLAVVTGIGLLRRAKVRPSAALPLLVAGLLITYPLSLRLYANAHDPLRAEAGRGGQAVIRAELAEGARPVRTEGFANQPGTARAVVVTADVLQARVNGVPVHTAGSVLIIAPAERWSRLLPGQQVTATGTLAPARSGELLAAVLHTRGPPAEITGAPWWQRAAESVRADLRDATRVLGEEEAGLLPGLVAGDTSAMPRRVEEEFLDAGMSHLLAVSGSNVAIVVGAVLLLLRLFRVGPRVSAAVACLALVGFLILVGNEPSVLRAGVMGAVGLLALLLGRKGSALPALAFAVVSLVLVDPAMAVSFGFALSVVATAALVLLAPLWVAGMRSRGVPPGVAEGLAIPLAAFVVTAPIIAGMAGEISLVTVAANILAAPVVAPATVLGVLAAVTAGTAPWLAELFVRLAGPEASWLIMVARKAAAVPGAVISWPDGWWGGLLAALVSAVGVLVFRYRRFRVAVAAALAGVLLVFVPVRAISPAWPPSGWAVAACDVGQGDGFVLATGEPGRAVVVDTGNELGAIDRCLDRLGVDRIPLVALSHLHADHIGGLSAVLDGRQVGGVAVGRGRAPHWAWHQVVAVADQFEVPLLELTAGERLRWPSLALHVIGPRHVVRLDAGEPDGTAINNTSLVIMATTPAARVLLTGDVELAAQADLVASGEDLRADVLKVPHHGSRFTSPEFLDAVAPRIALIGVGADNRYGHPNQGVLDMLTASGALVIRTDLHGDTALLADERGPLVIRAARGPPAARPLSSPARCGRRRRSAAPWPWGRFGPARRPMFSGRHP
ncbi:MAG: DNA internalization-related competence protein ComEC/Rec2 [Haloechinothrix sp.]